MLGFTLGFCVGIIDGVKLGTSVGLNDGNKLGTFVGNLLGTFDGY